MKHKNDVVRTKWDRENFNAACNSLKWLKENGSDEEGRKDASHILDKMIEYSFIYLLGLW